MIVHTGRFSGDDALKFPDYVYVIPFIDPIDPVDHDRLYPDKVYPRYTSRPMPPSLRTCVACRWRISYTEDPIHLAHRVEGVIVPSRYSHARTSRHVLGGWLDPAIDPNDHEVVNMHLKMILDRG